MGHQDAREKRSEGDISTLQGQRVQKLSLTVLDTELTESDGAQSFDFAEALPDDAVIVGVGLDVTEGFTDGVAGVFTADLGISGGDTDSLLDGADLASIAKVSSPQGVRPTGLYGGETIALDVKADVNVDTATAGEVTATVYFVDASVLDAD